MVYAITTSEAFRLETVSIGLALLTVWLTNPPQRSPIGSRPGRDATDSSWPRAANRTILIRSWDGTRFIPQAPGLQPLPVVSQWRRLQPAGVSTCKDQIPQAEACDTKTSTP